MDKLARMPEKDVRLHTRFMMEKCLPGGGWGMGTGNSVPNYIPAGNFLAMIEETMTYRP
jgi:uroporphyrinogen decarboxylase